MALMPSELARVAHHNCTTYSDATYLDARRMQAGPRGGSRFLRVSDGVTRGFHPTTSDLLQGAIWSLGARAS